MSTREEEIDNILSSDIRKEERGEYEVKITYNHTPQMRTLLLSLWDKAYEMGAMETKKAFGGCDNCFGKGYATVKRMARTVEDFGGEKERTWELDPIIPCSCDRGTQIKKILKR